MVHFNPHRKVAKTVSELPHVYQNREDGYSIHSMYFCVECNGYYGVPHDFDHAKHMREWGVRHCACRFHREQDGLPREGDFGFILKPKYPDWRASDPDWRVEES